MKIDFEKELGYSDAQIQSLRLNAAKDTTDTEMLFFLNVCKSTGLNPFVKQIWCYKAKDDLIIFTGRDGYLTNANTKKDYAGIRSSAIYDGDAWSVDIPNGIIEHKITKQASERGKIIAAYCIVFRKGGEQTVAFVDFNRYARTGKTREGELYLIGSWKSHPEDMIMKVAETRSLSKAFPLPGIQSEYEWEAKDDIVQPINSEPDKIDPLMEAKMEINARLRILLLSKDKQEAAKFIAVTCKEKSATDEFDITFATNIINQIDELEKSKE